MIVLLGFICPVYTRIMSSEDTNLHVLEQKARPSFPAPASIELISKKSFRYQKFRSTHCTVAVCAGITEWGHTVGYRHVFVPQLNLEFREIRLVLQRKSASVHEEKNIHIPVREEVILGWWHDPLPLTGSTYCSWCCNIEYITTTFDSLFVWILVSYGLCSWIIYPECIAP